MLPEKLSTDLTSLNEGEDRLALVIEMTVRERRVGGEGRRLPGPRPQPGQARLRRASAPGWRARAAPAKVEKIAGLGENLKLQDRTADSMRELRHENGALDLETIEARAVFADGKVVDLRQERRNNARMLIEDFMIARERRDRALPGRARPAQPPPRRPLARALGPHREDRRGPGRAAAAGSGREARWRSSSSSSARRTRCAFPISRWPSSRRWARANTWSRRRDEPSIGHFGLAVKDYTHSTAPNRRFPDLITHRLVKAALAGAPAAYTRDELAALAAHCTEQEDAANKVERQVRKSAAACLLSNRIGEKFDAIVTGAGERAPGCASSARPSRASSYTGGREWTSATRSG